MVYSSPGVLVQNQGSDYRGTPGIYVDPSGGAAGKAVAYSELASAAAAIEEEIAAMESAYMQADVSINQAWQAAVAAVSAQLQAALQGVTDKISVAARITSLASVNTITSLLSTANPSTNPDAWFIVDSGTLSADNGVYYLNGSTPARVPKYSTVLSLGAGTLAFVDKGTFANTFWLIPDAPTGSGTNITGVSFIPFGRVQELTIAPGTFLTLAANQLNANLNGSYFEVVNGALTLKTAFTDRIVALESTVATNTSNISAAQAAITALQAQIQTRIVASQVSQAIGNFYAATHKILTLSNGATFLNLGVLSTVFYADPGFGTLNFAVVRISRITASFLEYARPQIEYVTTNGSGVGGFFAKITFFQATAIADNTVRIYCERFYDAAQGETINVSVPAA